MLTPYAALIDGIVQVARSKRHILYKHIEIIQPVHAGIRAVPNTRVIPSGVPIFRDAVEESAREYKAILIRNQMSHGVYPELSRTDST